jgi:asparagine synthase (glutamine-hydrolysing)
MCGIAAIFAYRDSAPVVEEQELLRIREAMSDRGPDGAGLWISADRRIGLAHRRLAIIDVGETGAQPMTIADGTVRVVFNGEIYNYREVRRKLEAKGCAFRSQSDTEVLLHLYKEYGVDLAKELRGMYAFAIYDSRRRGLLLARDPYGIKPLYFADDGRTIHAASQVKALLKSQMMDTEAEPAGHVGFFLWGSIPEPYTLYRGIRALTPGTTLWIDTQGGKQVRRMFNVSNEFANACQAPAQVTQHEGRERLRIALVDSVRHHLVADVPVGMFLSAGIDSCALTALLREVGAPRLRTITLGFTEFRGTQSDEVPLAEQIAKHYATHHHTAWIAKADFETHRHAILDAMDQPSIDGINTYFVSKAAADAGLKVALSGVGGDELFSGYPSFQQIPRLVNAASPVQAIPLFGKGFRYLSASILKHLTSPKYAGLFEYGGTYGGAYLLRRGMFMPWELPGLLDAEMVRVGWKELQTLSHLENSVAGITTSHLKVSSLESTWYLRNQLLRDADWASMAHGVEVRTPFVDWELLQNVAPLHATPSCLSKAALAQTSTESLPDAVLTRGKTGFTVPVRDWLLEALRSKERGLRGWAKLVHRKQSNAKRAMVFVTDAYGGSGGIAKFNRDFLGSCAEQGQFREVVTLPRIMSEAIEQTLPKKVRYLRGASNGKLQYVGTLLKLLLSHQRFDVVVCGHLNLLPLAWLASRFQDAPLVLIIHGIEAWKPTSSWLVNSLARKIDCLISVSAFTRDRFSSWTSLDSKPTFILPNTVDMKHFQPRPKKQELLTRHRLHDKKVIMTLGRLDSRESYKGVDEVLEVLPRLLEDMPNLIYLIVGSGTDIPRLKHKVELLGLVQNVEFAGAISEAEKVDYYNLADAFVMPGRGEGFGIVYLEAMACGVPVVGSTLDGSREALLDGKLGQLVNPNDPTSVMSGITEALAHEKNAALDLRNFSPSHFQGDVHRILEGIS